MIMVKFQNLAKALMGAVAVMPIAALLVGGGYWIDPVGWGDNNLVAAVLIRSGQAVLDNIGLLFAVALGYGLSRDKNGAAALSSLIGFLTVTALISSSAVAGYRGIDVDALSGQAAIEWAAEGWNTVGNGNVLFGIIIGVMTAILYNHFYATKLPDSLAFFSGRRLVPIVTSLSSVVLAGCLYFVWPALHHIMFNFGLWVQSLDAAGAGIYATVNRLLIPTGLHHALNSIFWFDVVGINDLGNFLNGGDTLTAATVATDAASCPGVWDGHTCEVTGIIGRYQAGFFPIMMFGLPGAALAMYLRADQHRKKLVGSLMLAGALASFATGVTEPLEFSFMFVAPLLYVVHAVLTGIAVFIAAAFHWTAGFGFSAGGIDLMLSSQNPLAHQWWMLLPMGIVFFALYFVIFYSLIGWLNLHTPGRDVEEALVGNTLSSDTELAAAAAHIITGLGGRRNITHIDYCATRLRANVKNSDVVSETELKKAGIAGVIRPTHTTVQVVIGPKVQFVYDEISHQLHPMAASTGSRRLW